MILYALACHTGHRFDSWFRDSHAFETQVAAGLVACPVCASVEVGKAIMAPAVVGARKAPPVKAEPAPAQTAPAETKPTIALLDEPSRELRALVRQLRNKMTAEGHDVGRDFAKEARRIHEGEAPHRQIYGQASLTEARDLLEDGITVLPLPIVPDDLN